MGRVEGERCQRRVNGRLEVAPHQFLLPIVQIPVIADLDPGPLQRWPEGLAVAGRLCLEKFPSGVHDRGPLLSGRHTVGRRLGHASVDLLVKSPDAFHEELVEV